MQACDVALSRLSAAHAPLPPNRYAGWVLSHDALRLDMEDLQRLLDALSAQVGCAPVFDGLAGQPPVPHRAVGLQLIDSASETSALSTTPRAGGGGAAAGEVAAGGSTRGEACLPLP